MHTSSMGSRGRRLCRCVVLVAATLLMPFAGAGEPTILDHSSSAPGKRAPYQPEVYGSSPAAEQQAAAILLGWRSEPVSLPWTSLMLSMFVKHKIAPSRAARGSALMHVAMYDAFQMASDEPSRSLLVSAAAVQVLAYLFPAEEHGFDRVLASLVRQHPNDSLAPPVRQALELGRRVGQTSIARGEADGAARGWNGVRLEWYGEGRYYGPSAWAPTAPYFYYPPDEPFAPKWKTWFWQIDHRARPVPPAFSSARYLKDLQEVIDIQQTLTADQLRIAKFWVDGSGSMTPPGHWNQIGIELVRKARLDNQRTVALFAMLNIALADTFIAAWDVKYYYWTARPITMAKTVYGVDLKTAILTPPFPSYLSGHAAFSGAAATVLGDFFPQHKVALDAMAQEAAMSRLYGGIHFRHDNEDGLALGRAVAALTLRKLGRSP